MECADVSDDDDGDDWVCRLCLSMPGELPKYAVAMPTRFPPDGVPLYKCVDIWLDSADSMFGTIELAGSSTIQANWQAYTKRNRGCWPKSLAIVAAIDTAYHTGATKNDRIKKPMPDSCST